LTVQPNPNLLVVESQDSDESFIRKEPLVLNDVTMIALDCVAHPLTRLALEDSLLQIQPKEVIVWTDQKITVPKDARMIESDFRSLDAVATALWEKVYKEVKTSHILLVQWDGWVIDAGQWNSQWLNYDFIGAPWFYDDGMNVGNGGFSLRSVDLMRFVATHSDRFLVWSPEDVALCRQYRKLLEAYSLQWAPESVARKFSFERTEPASTFGFHGSFNWSKVLDKESLYARITLASGIPYVQAKTDFEPAKLMVAAA
jgi:hypothetical protein